MDHELRVYVEQVGDRTSTTDAINRRINELFAEHNIDIAFNQLDVFIKNNDTGEEIPFVDVKKIREIMAGNTIGQLFRVTTFGESHGIALGCIVDGVPPNLELSEQDIQPDLDRRKPGTSRYTTPRREDDEVQILSGVFEGKTTGTSIGMIIKMLISVLKIMARLKIVFALVMQTLPISKKYGIRDYRGGGRSSARETAMRVAAGAIAKKNIYANILVLSPWFLSQIGHVKISPQIIGEIDWEKVNSNPFFCPDESAVEKFDELIRELKKRRRFYWCKTYCYCRKCTCRIGRASI